MKSLVGAYNHQPARELAYALELMGKEQNLEDASDTLQRLGSLMDEFVEAIREYAAAHA